MDSFGTKIPRSLTSFGVAGTLGEECRVFYQNIFSAKHVGRLSDLLAARLNDANPDQLRLRALILYAVFEAYQSQAKNDKGVLDDPIVVECGIDDEKIGVSVSFVPAEDLPLQGLEERLRNLSPEGPFEELLAYLVGHAHRVVLRHEPASRRLEVVALMGIPGKIDEASLATPHSLELVVIEDKPQNTPKAISYTELGDLDYPTLLREELPQAVKGLPASPTGKILADATGADLDSLVSGRAGDLPDLVRVSGAPRASGEDDKIVVSGGPQDGIDGSVAVVSGGTAASGGEDTQPDGSVESASTSPLAGAAPVVDAGGELAAFQVKLYEDRISELSRRIAQLEAERTQKFLDSGAGAAELGVDDADSVEALETELGTDEAPESGGLLKKMWPFKKGAAGEEASGEGSEEKDSDAGETISYSRKKKKKKKGEDDPGEPTPVDESERTSTVQSVLEATAKVLQQEIDTGTFDETIRRAQKEMKDIKRDLNTPAAQKWAEGLLSDLIAQKARLADMAKKVNSSIRVKELEFKNREQALMEELRRRDEQLRQKTTALLRAKEQAQESAKNLGLVKNKQASGADVAMYRQKLEQTQKILIASKEESYQKTAKIEELRKALQTAQIKNRSGPSIAEYSALQTKFERAQKQADDFKKANQALMDRLRSASIIEKAPARGAAAAAAGMDEMRKRLENAMKMITTSKRETARLTVELEDLHKEESKLKRELILAQEELKRLKAGGGKKAA